MQCIGQLREIEGTMTALGNIGTDHFAEIVANLQTYHDSVQAELEATFKSQEEASAA